MDPLGQPPNIQQPPHTQPDDATTSNDDLNPTVDTYNKPSDFQEKKAQHQQIRQALNTHPVTKPFAKVVGFCWKHKIQIAGAGAAGVGVGLTTVGIASGQPWMVVLGACMIGGGLAAVAGGPLFEKPLDALIRDGADLVHIREPLYQAGAVLVSYDYEEAATTIKDSALDLVSFCTSGLSTLSEWASEGFEQFSETAKEWTDDIQAMKTPGETPEIIRVNNDDDWIDDSHAT